MWQHVVVRRFEEQIIALDTHEVNEVNISQEVTRGYLWETNLLHQWPDVLVSILVKHEPLSSSFEKLQFGNVFEPVGIKEETHIFNRKFLDLLGFDELVQVLSDKGVSFFFDFWELKLLGNLDDVDTIEDGDFALKNI